MESLVAVIITTSYRGVFFGWIKPEEKKEKTIEVIRCRNVRYWTSETDGFQGLSSNGPNKSCKISAEAGGPCVIHDITSVTQCSESAVEKWLNL